MNDVDTFQEILLLRTFFKVVSQVSWDIAQLEKRHPLESCTEEELASIKKAYLGYIMLLQNSFPTT